MNPHVYIHEDCTIGEGVTLDAWRASRRLPAGGFWRRFWRRFG